jgi:dTDP-4-amino-4,6-dideoxygalactose transaminase
VSGDKIPLARPSVGDAEAAALARVLGCGRLVSGPENERFERMLADRCGRANAVAVSSGTVALELSLWVLGVGEGDEVLVPAFGFPSAASAAARCGAVPVAVDVDRATWNLDVADAGAVATDKTRAVVGIDQFGLVADAAQLETFARGADLHLVADSACSLGGADAAGVRGGGYGELSILSFHPRKVVTTGEGGAVLCDDDGLAAELRKLRNVGQAGAGRFDRLGTNARLSELAAAIGSVQLSRLDDMLAERRLLAEGYLERLAPLRESGRLSTQHVPAGAKHSYQTFAVVLSESYSRDAVRSQLDEAGVESGPGTYAFTRLDAFRDRVRPVPAADSLHDRSLALPLYVGMRSAELDRVVAALTEALA